MSAYLLVSSTARSLPAENLQTCCTCRQTGSAPATAPAYPPAGSSNAFKTQLRNNITKIPEQYTQQGIPASQQELYDHGALQQSLKQDYVPVDLQHPGMTVQSLEPPVLTINNFLTADECDQLAQAAEATGKSCSDNVVLALMHHLCIVCIMSIAEPKCVHIKPVQAPLLYSALSA